MKWIKKVAATPLESVARVIDSLTSENERTNAPSIRAVKEAVDDGWLKIYPIGSIYMNVTNVDPATLFGGTWVQIKDTFLLSCGDTYDNGATGGSATIDPNSFIWTHDHFIDGLAPSTYSINRYVDGDATKGLVLNTAEAGAGTEKFWTVVSGSSGSATRNAGNYTESGDSNMPPYLAVYVWKRTA